jgi:RimJ/RimL family protein N-acetyltransferase
MLMMEDAAKFVTAECLRDGKACKIRALKPDDEQALLAAVDHVSAQSLYRRFFSPKRHFSDAEKDYYLHVDFVDHVALVAIIDEDGHDTIVGGGRYVVIGPKTAEVAFAVVDEYQGQGVGSALMRHLAAIARNAGLEALVAEVLPENLPMLKVFERSGLAVRTAHERGVVHVTMGL